MCIADMRMSAAFPKWKTTVQRRWVLFPKWTVTDLRMMIGYTACSAAVGRMCGSFPKRCGADRGRKAAKMGTMAIHPVRSC